jgi:hypothetical protein
MMTVIPLGFAIARTPNSARSAVAGRGAKPNCLPQLRCIAVPILLHLLAANRACQLSSCAALGALSNIYNSAQVSCYFSISRVPVLNVAVLITLYFQGRKTSKVVSGAASSAQSLCEPYPRVLSSHF